MASSDVLILCGGRGKRFQSVRTDIPKCLAPIGGKPFLDHLLSRFFLQGFKRIILATGYLGNQVEKHIDQNYSGRIICSHEVEPLGTGGAVKNAAHLFRTKTIIVVNGDSFIKCQFKSLLSFHEDSSADISLLLSSETFGQDYGNAEVSPKGRVTRFSEKTIDTLGPLVNAGIYCMKTQVLTTIESNKKVSLERDCLPIWVDKFWIMANVTDERVYDIGTPDRYELASRKRIFD